MLDWLKKLFQSSPPRPVGELPRPSEKVIKLVREEQAIAAIKLYREENVGIGLKEAKDIVDALRR